MQGYVLYLQPTKNKQHGQQILLDCYAALPQQNWFLQKQVPTKKPLVEQILHPIRRAGAARVAHLESPQ